MEFYLPSFLVILLAVFIITVYLPAWTPAGLAILATVALGLAVKNHIDTFAPEYNVMGWTVGVGPFAPTVLVGVVIVFSVGYLILQFTTGRPMRLPSIRETIPPPETSTNILTRSINNTLRAAGAASISANTPKTPLLSINPSLSPNVSERQRQSILAARLRQAV